MTDLIARVEVAEITATVETKELVAQVGFTAPVLPDYFRWRQEHFDPYFHLPLNDPPGSTVAKALAGPDGVHSGAVTTGEKGLIQPPNRYPSTLYMEGGDTDVGARGDFDWTHETWFFTAAFWVKLVGPRDTPTRLVFGTNPTGSNAAGFGFALNAKGSTVIEFVQKNGSSTRRAWFRSTSLRDDEEYELSGPIHVAGTSDGEKFRLFIDGRQVDTENCYPPVGPGEDRSFITSWPARSSQYLSGLLIDTRPWTPEEVQEDYLRGMGVWE